MAKLHSLIRFKRHELDEKRRILVERNKELDILQEKKRKMIEALAHEKNLAAVDVEVARNFGVYLERMLREQEELDQKIQLKLQDVQAATLVVQEAFLEAKKLEITQEKRDAEEQARLDKIDSDTMDEIGLENFRRKTIEEDE